jgi:hypothetical protein
LNGRGPNRHHSRLCDLDGDASAAGAFVEAANLACN